MRFRVRERQESKLFAVLPGAHRGLAAVWWLLLIFGGSLPAVFAIAMGRTVAAVQRGGPLAGPLTLVGVVFGSTAGRRADPDRGLPRSR